MLVRKLETWEHGRTRTLWEAVFQEDSRAFLDYYYTVKTVENEIYVVEEDGKIVSMLHLNPYQLRVNQEIVRVHYIVAVATEEGYRSRGLMRVLLTRAMEDMRKDGRQFTFLMPAAEAIYAPYEFRFVYRQNRKKIPVLKPDTGLELVDATTTDCGMLSAFANRQLQGQQVVAYRDASYYETLLAESKSEQGGVLMAKRAGHLVGILCYARGEHLVVREPLFECGHDLAMALGRMTCEGEVEVEVEGVTEAREAKPMIMVRILHLEDFLRVLTVTRDFETTIAVRDTCLQENTGRYHLVGRQNGSIEIRIEDLEAEDASISIGALTSLLFGYLSVDEVREQECVPDGVHRLMDCIEPLSKVFLNEVV